MPGSRRASRAGSTSISRALAAIARDATVATETLALFVRYFLTVTPPVPDSDQEPARAHRARSASRCSSPRSASASPRPPARGRGAADRAGRPAGPVRHGACRRRPGSQLRLSSVTQPTARPRRTRGGRRSWLISSPCRWPRRRRAAAGRCCAPPSGPTIAAALADPTVIEVMVNPDGSCGSSAAAVGRRDTGERLGAAEAERIIRLVAAHVRREVTDKAPIVSAELPETGERFEGVMPPVAPAPCFSIRKPARRALPARRLRGRAHHDAARRPQAARARRSRDGARTSSSPAAPPRARPRWSTRCWPRSPASTSASSSWRTRASSSAPPPTGGAAHQARRRHARRPRALDAAAAPRPHHRRRGARARRPSTCSRPGTPAIPAASPPCTPTPRRAALYRLEQLVQEAVVTVPRDADRRGHRPRRLPRRDAAASRRVETLARGRRASMPTATTS